MSYPARAEGLVNSNIRSLLETIDEYIIVRTGQMSRVFANGPGDQGSMLSRVIPKTPKMVLDAALFNSQHYKVHI